MKIVLLIMAALAGAAMPAERASAAHQDMVDAAEEMFIDVGQAVQCNLPPIYVTAGRRKIARFFQNALNGDEFTAIQRKSDRIAANRPPAMIDCASVVMHVSALLDILPPTSPTDPLLVAEIQDAALMLGAFDHCHPGSSAIEPVKELMLNVYAYYMKDLTFRLAVSDLIDRSISEIAKRKYSAATCQVVTVNYALSQYSLRARILGLPATKEYDFFAPLWARPSLKP